MNIRNSFVGITFPIFDVASDPSNWFLNKRFHRTLGARGIFFSLGATELSGEAAKASREATRKNTTRSDTTIQYKHYSL